MNEHQKNQNNSLKSLINHQSVIQLQKDFTNTEINNINNSTSMMHLNGNVSYLIHLGEHLLNADFTLLITEHNLFSTAPEKISSLMICLIHFPPLQTPAVCHFCVPLHCISPPLYVHEYYWLCELLEICFLN